MIETLKAVFCILVIRSLRFVGADKLAAKIDAGMQ